MKNKINQKRVLLLIKANIIEKFSTITKLWIAFTILVGGISFCVSAVNIGNIEDNIEYVVGLLYTMLFLTAITAFHINDLMFMGSIKKLSQLYKYTLPASIAEKYIANTTTALFVAPLLPIASFIIMMIIPTIMFHAFSDANGFFLFSVITQVVPSLEVGLNFIWIFLIIVGVDIVCDIYWWNAKKTMLSIGFILGIVGYYIMSGGYFNRLFETTNITTYIIYPTITIIAWTASYYTFKRKELK